MDYRLLLLLPAIAAGPALAQAGAKPRPKTAPRKAPTGKAPARPPAGPDLPSRLPATAPFITVNGEKVPISEYVDRLSLRFAPNIREELLNEALVRQEAKRRKLAVSPAELAAEVKRAIEEQVRRYGDQEKFVEELKNARGWSLDDYRAIIRSQADVTILRLKIADSLAAPDSVTEKDVADRYEAQKENFVVRDSVRISHILLRRPGDGDEKKDNAVRSRAEGLLRSLQATQAANFAQVAQENSDDQLTGGKGGTIPTDIHRGANPFGAAFDAAVFAPDVKGLVPSVVPTPLGYHIIRVDSRKPGRTMPLDEVKADLRKGMLMEKRGQLFEELMVRLRTKARVETGRF